MAAQRQGYVGVGSNVEPEAHVLAALDLLRARLTVTAVSTFYRTAPLARPEQPPFANGVFGVVTDLAPRQLKLLLCAVEARLGRRRTADRHARRTLDLDLLLLGDLTVRLPRLTLPDPDIRRRPFVAVPLAELAPDLILPDTREPLAHVVTAVLAGGSGGVLTPLGALTAALRRRLSGP